MINLKYIKSIFSYELNLVISDHSILLTVIIAPLLYAFFLGSIYLNKDIDQIRFAVVDNDYTQTSRELTRLISASQKVNMAGYLESYDEGVDELKRLNIQGFLVFTKGFERDFKRNSDAVINLYLNTTQFLPSNDLNMAINEVILFVGSEVRLNYYMASGTPESKSRDLINPLVAEVNPIYNVTNSYGGFLLPGLFFLILQQTLLIGLGESVARDKEKGRLGDLLRSHSSGFVNYLFGKSAYYLFLYIAYILIFISVVFPLFELPVVTSVISLSLISVVFFMAIILLTILIGTFVNSQIRMMEILAFTSYPFFLLSGYSWPISAMPLPLQWLSAAIPTTPMMKAMTRLIVMGGTWEDILVQFYQLLLLVVSFLILLIWRLTYLKTRMFHARLTK
jgi:ABC-2 type transport system permease protein